MRDYPPTVDPSRLKCNRVWSVCRSLVPLQDIASRRRLDHRKILGSQRRLRLHFLAAVTIEPRGPGGPPASRMLGRAFEPVVGVFGKGFIVRVELPETALVLRRRVDDARNMSRCAEDKRLRPGEQWRR